MGRRLLFLNLLLLAGIGICAQQLLSGWGSFQSEQNVNLMIEDAGRVAGGGAGPIGDLVGDEVLSHDFFVIAERDLFRPERRPADESDADASVVEVPEFPKRPQMHGATTIGGEQKAFLTLFDSPKSTGSPRIVGLGETVQEYAVAEITGTTVTLRWNDHVEIIDMMDSEPSQKAGPAATKVAAVNIIRIGSRHAAVETTAPDEPARQEEGGGGLDIGVVGGQMSRQGQGAMGRGQGMIGGSTRGQGTRPTNLGVPQPRGRTQRPFN